jgi:hypothetical protein
MDNAKPGRRPGRSVLCVYVRTRTRPGDKVRRKNSPDRSETGARPKGRPIGAGTIALGVGIAAAGAAAVAIAAGSKSSSSSSTTSHH